MWYRKQKSAGGSFTTGRCFLWKFYKTSEFIPKFQTHFVAHRTQTTVAVSRLSKFHMIVVTKQFPVGFCHWLQQEKIIKSFCTKYKRMTHLREQCSYTCTHKEKSPLLCVLIVMWQVRLESVCWLSCDRYDWSLYVDCHVAGTTGVWSRCRLVLTAATSASRTSSVQWTPSWCGRRLHDASSLTSTHTYTTQSSARHSANFGGKHQHALHGTRCRHGRQITTSELF